MLSELCAECRNWFIRDDSDMHFGTFTIENGNVAPFFGLQQTKTPFRIIGSRYNDGVYYLCEELTQPKTDETFEGAIWIMSVPREFVELSMKIDSYAKEHEDMIHSPFTSESFGGYTYQKSNGSDSSWQKVFSHEIARWRKL